ncbi:hypothetical protein H112_01396 [Trichophyton rubrum D6]|uniref:Uncharacterized protein n=2 Tax=Trichophyton TaxID=5550 RepID=A0A022WDF8_TRIRU|nr:hypothetical protein H100_01390 [Trichophyton rubrum MR850]EZF45504.1 hypothetical protein H102_01385 [Trichophyton rubrum CBS 100081]EZF56151.1 hypothetical protein H103_01395 [Trichophyton rubrum CBS 288.86]EZF66762.1 hypothetical protein H104_01375 [Trichophyton rubrum CBS 289.86]EZF77395.1 hypothetical protein H105_01405 [Trichophyton soudanense CBS 452.61]EZF88050.1 hypothetical protein H110_01394 [Trichophyton rubrum MR1448]EZF98838.1 hypothetical protein H113_01398 [Trichophyton rub
MSSWISSDSPCSRQLSLPSGSIGILSQCSKQPAINCFLVQPREIFAFEIKETKASFEGLKPSMLSRMDRAFLCSDAHLLSMQPLCYHHWCASLLF